MIGCTTATTMGGTLGVGIFPITVLPDGSGVVFCLAHFASNNKSGQPTVWSLESAHNVLFGTAAGWVGVHNPPNV